MSPAGPDGFPDPLLHDSLAVKLRADREFWDSMAQRDAWFAVLSAPEARDPALRDAFFQRTTAEDLRRLGWFLHPGSRVLDLGCGVGRLTGAMAPLCGWVTGVDISPVMAGVARERLVNLSNVSILESDGQSLKDIASESIDFVTSLLCLIHVDQRAARLYFHEIRRVLRVGGRGWLQFQDSEQPEGALAVASGGRGGFPMVGWTEEDLVSALAAADLGVMGVTRSRGFIDLQICRGSSTAERRRVASALSFGALTGIPIDGRIQLGQRHRLVLPVSAQSQRTECLGAVLALVPRGGGLGDKAWHYSEATLALSPGLGSYVAFEFGGDQPPRIEVRGGTVALTASHSLECCDVTEATLHVGLLPAGFSWNLDSITLFPNCARSISVLLVP